MPSKNNPNKIAVVDLEATCWDGPPQPYSEVIEVGVCFVLFDNNTVEIQEPFNIKVKPTNTKISQYCTDLTGWTWSLLRPNAVTYETACKQLIKKGLRNCVFGSWGHDQNLIKIQCDRENAIYPIGDTCLNIQNLFALKFGLNKEPSLEAALELLKWPFDGRQHCGKDDAYNTAKILVEILRGQAS